MGYMVPCVPGNHQADTEAPGTVFKSMIDPRYPPEAGQMMNVYSCAEHAGRLAEHCGKWTPHDCHETCGGTPDGEMFSADDENAPAVRVEAEPIGQL